MNIIFLDIDGVLNDLEYFNRLKKKRRSDTTLNDGIDESRVELLKQIYDICNAKIVLSSTWRELADSNSKTCQEVYQYLVDTLRKYGMEIMSSTPIIGYNRPLEIKTWLDNWKNKGDLNFVSLDDDFSYEKYNEYDLGGCLISTDFFVEVGGGLQQNHVDKAIKALKGL